MTGGLGPCVPSRPDVTGGRAEASPLSVLNLLNSDHRRGAEAFGVDLGKALAARSIHVDTVALTASGSPHNFGVPSLGRRSSSLIEASWKLRKRQREVDVTVAHGGRTLLTAAIVNALGGSPFVYRVIGEPRYWAARPDRRARVRAGLRRAARIAVYYRGAADELVSQFDVDPSRIEVIPKGVSAASYPPGSGADRLLARARFGLADRAGPLIVYLGALSAPKNVEQIIKAAASIPHATVLIVGDGDDRGRLEAVARDEDVDTVFSGASSHPAEALHAADVVALTSRTEGMPSVLIEAGLACKPVVATRVGGVPHIVEDRQTGLLVDIDDIEGTARALTEALGAREELGRAARERCLHEFNLDRVAERWDELLRSVAGEGR